MPRKTSAILALILILCSCTKDRLEQAARITEEGFIDYNIPIKSFEVLPNGSNRIKAIGTLDEVMIGLVLELYPQWKSQKISDTGADSFYWGNGRLISLSAPTDSFIEIMANDYGIDVSNPHAIDQIEVSIVGLADDPRQIQSKPVRMKLFLNSDDEDRYSEVFFNVDLKSGWIGFHEKDQGYRVPLIQSLKRQA